VLLFFNLLGGIALVLYGVRTLRKGLDRLLGERLGALLEHASCTPPRALLTGLGISFLAPSSTSLSNLAVRAVQARHVTPRQMLLVMLGADIGLTATVQLLSLKIEHFAPIFILFGVAFYQYAKSVRLRGFGQIALSFGFLFLGVGFIGQAAAGVNPGGDFARVLQIVSNHPAILAAAAALIAVGLQSSTATVGLIVGLSGAAGGSGDGFALPLAAAVAAVAGANVGVALTTLMMGWAQVESRRLALGILLSKIVVAALFLLALPLVLPALTATSMQMPRQVANAHTGFNVLKLLLVLPFVPLLIRAVENLVPAGTQANDDPARPRYLENQLIDGNTLALSQSLREILRVAEIVRGMCDDVWRALKSDDEQLVKEISDRDNQVDQLDAHIKRFLARLDAHSLDPDQAGERLRQLTYLSELETIGDLVDKNLCELVRKKIRRRIAFSPQAWAVLDDLDRRVSENMLIADAAFHTRDADLAAKLLRHKEYIDREVRQLRDTHFYQLNSSSVADAHDSSAVHLDLLTNLRRINSHVSHVAFGLTQANATRLTGESEN
jgi:phosphate:Na+ symporter